MRMSESLSNLTTAVNFVLDTLQGMTPEQAILTGANVLVTGAAYVGVRICPKLAFAIGSGIYGAAHLIGWATKKEVSPACQAALDALEDQGAQYEERTHDTTGATLRRLNCAGLSVSFRQSGDVLAVSLPGADLAEVLAGGEKGREYRKVVARACKRRDEVIERDRKVLNELVAQAVCESKAKVEQSRPDCTLDQLAAMKMSKKKWK